MTTICTLVERLFINKYINKDWEQSYESYLLSYYKAVKYEKLSYEVTCIIAVTVLQFFIFSVEIIIYQWYVYVKKEKKKEKKKEEERRKKKEERRKEERSKKKEEESVVTY